MDQAVIDRPEINERTRRLYESRADLLIRRANGLTEDISYVATANFLGQMAKDGKLSVSSARVYRAALQRVFADQPLNDTQEALDILAGLQLKSQRPQRQLKSDRAKAMPLEDFQALCSHLLSSSYHMRDRGSSLRAPLLAAYWLGVTIETGLRPVEWAATTLSDWNDQGSPAAELLARTAKVKAGHAVRVRAIGIDDRDTFDSVRGFLAVYATWLASLRKTYPEAGDAESELARLASHQIRRASERLWSNDPTRRYSLYSARHQSAANHRYLSGLHEAARVLGHDLRTNAQYGSVAQPWAVKHHDPEAAIRGFL